MTESRFNPPDSNWTCEYKGCGAVNSPPKSGEPARPTCAKCGRQMSEERFARGAREAIDREPGP